MSVARWLCLCIPLIAVIPSACVDRDPLAPSYAVTRGAPAAPTGLTATASTYSEIVLAWVDNASNDAGVEVYRSTNGPTGSFTLFTTYAGPNITTGGNGGLQASTQYCYKVRAFSSQGNSGKVRAYSDFSNTACVTTPGLPVPAAPSNVRAAPDAWSRIQITWSDNASNENGVRVERAATSAGPWTGLGTANPNTVTFYDNQPPALELSACYRVAAFNGFGESPASNVACTARPAAPSALEATAAGSAVDLLWTDNSNVEDGYQIQRWTEESGASVITVVAELPANTTTYHDAGLADGRHWYQVRSMRDGGTSGSSNNASAMILTRPPIAPELVDVFAASSSVVTVIVTDNSTNEDGFRVERLTDVGDWILAGYATVDPYWPTGQFTIVGQPSDQQVCYRIIAFNSLGDSPPSNTDCSALPLGPTNLRASAGSSQTIDLTWIDNSGVEDGYEVDALLYYCGEYDEWGYCVWYPYYQPIATLGANATSFQVTGLNQGESWTFVIVALKDGGRSDLSNEATAIVP